MDPTTQFTSAQGDVSVASRIHVAFWCRHLGVSAPVLWMSIADVGFGQDDLTRHVATLHRSLGGVADEWSDESP